MLFHFRKQSVLSHTVTVGLGCDVTYYISVPLNIGLSVQGTTATRVHPHLPGEQELVARFHLANI